MVLGNNIIQPMTSFEKKSINTLTIIHVYFIPCLGAYLMMPIGFMTIFFTRQGATLLYELESERGLKLEGKALQLWHTWHNE